MKRFIIIETARYSVQAPTAQDALDNFLGSEGVKAGKAIESTSVTERTVVDDNEVEQDVKDL